MNYSELAWLLLEQRRPVDEVCKRTGFPRVLVERMAVDMEKQQAIKQAERAVRKAERQVELAAIRMERGCPMCNTGYANVVATCFPPYSNVREFTDRPVDFFMHATCLNQKCPMQTLQPMPDEHTAIEYFKNGWSWKPATGYVRLTPLGQEYVFKDLMKRGYTAAELKQTTLPITMCETVEDVLSLDATVDKERLRRAIAHPLDDTTIEADWADDLANDPEGEGILRPDEMVFLDKGLNSWFVKGSGMCYGYDGCCMEDLIPYLYNKPRRENGLLYTDRNNDLWVMERPVLTPVADRECCLAVADPFIDINKTCDGMFFHRKDKTSPDFYLFGFSLAQYQHVLRCHAPLTQIEVEAHPMSYDEWLNS